jgi:hypothetical protein
MYKWELFSAKVPNDPTLFASLIMKVNFVTGAFVIM